MSYAALILKDSPEVVWNLEETSGIFVEPDRFANSEEYRGTYYESKIKRSSVPIVYAGKVSIYNSEPYYPAYSLDNRMISLPSLGKFSASTKAQSYSLEFWMNLSVNTSNLASGAESRIGESRVVAVSGSSYSGLYIRDLDYLVFKIGDSGFRKFESAVHVPSFNTPLHIVMIYTKFSIQLIVNGVEGKIARFSEDIFGAEQERTIDFLFPDRINSSSEYFDGISYDTIATYPHALTPSAAKRHYVYGLGYDVPKYLIKNYGGVTYDTNLQLTTPLKKINYLDNETWSSRVKLENLVATKNNLSTATFNNHSLVVSSNTLGITETDMIFYNDGQGLVTFPESVYSYLEINNYESITSGQTKKIDAAFCLLDTHSTSIEQQLMYIGSKSISSKYISCVIQNRTITVKYKNIDDVEQQVTLLDLTAGASEFLISIALNNGDIAVSIVDESNKISTSTISNLSMFPMQDSYIRFGSAPIFFGNSEPKGLTEVDVKRFDGGVSQVDITASSSITTTWSAKQKLKISDLYQLYPNSDTKNICVATSGTFTMTIPLLDLIGLEYYDQYANYLNGLAARVEIGSNNAEIIYNSNVTPDGVNTFEVVTKESDDIRNLRMWDAGGDLTQQLQYEIVGKLRSSDIFTVPGVLDYFRIYTYKVDSDLHGRYIEINDFVPGTNMKYYAGFNFAKFIQLPELEQTTDLHRSFNTGVRVGSLGSEFPHLGIEFDVRTVSDTTATKIKDIMFVGRHVSGDVNDVVLAYIPGFGSITLGDPEPVGLGIHLYINGERYNSSLTYDFELWTHFCIKITNGIDYNSTIYFGYDGAGWLVDNISIMTAGLGTGNIKYLYGKYFGDTSERVPVGQDSNYLNILITDSELSDGVYTYQPLGIQNAFISRSLCPDLATTKNLDNFNLFDIGIFTYTYNNNRDMLKIDDVEIQVGQRILVKDQTVSDYNGIYLITAKTSSTVTFEKQGANVVGNVVFVKGGNENKNYYFVCKDAASNFEKTIVQKKAVAYNDVTAAITATVRYSA